MNRAKVYSNRQYLCWAPRGISGFRKPSVLALASGALYKRDGSQVYTAPLPKPASALLWRLENGRLPEFQPVVSFDEACAWVAANPYAYAIAVL